MSIYPHACWPQMDWRKPFWWSAVDVRCYELVFVIQQIKARNAGEKGCALLCAVLLHYASCDPNMYCILQKKSWCQSEAEREMHLPRHARTEQWTFHRQYMEEGKKKCCTVTESSTSSQQKELWETPSDPAFCFSLPDLYLELQSKPSVKCLEFCFCLLALDHTFYRQ